MARKRTRRSPFRLEANAVFEQTMRDGNAKVRAEYDAIKTEIKQALVPLYLKYEGKTMNKETRSELEAMIALLFKGITRE